MDTNQFIRRPTPTELKKQIIIAAEGNKTEPAYFNYLNKKRGSELFLPIERGHRPAPPSVLEDLIEYLKLNNSDLDETDEYWIVSDVNTWTKSQQQKVTDWCEECPEKNFLAVSNPCFEIWLILHFEENPKQFRTSKLCKKYYCDNYGDIKEIEDFENIKSKHVEDAITRAEKRDNSGDLLWPKDSGVTTVYKLVKKSFED